MKIPDGNIKIGVYDFEMVKGNLEEQLGDSVFGQTHNLVQKIWIDTVRTSKTRQEVTFFHEIIHQISNNSSLNLSESQVNNLAHGIHQVLKDNGILK